MRWSRRRRDAHVEDFERPLGLRSRADTGRKRVVASSVALPSTGCCRKRSQHRPARRAKSARIVLRTNRGRVLLEVREMESGSSAARPKRGRGRGHDSHLVLLIMRERAEYVRRDIDIRSVPGLRDYGSARLPLADAAAEWLRPRARSSPMPKILLLLADDHLVLRAVWHSARRAADIPFVGGSDAAAVSRGARLRPDIVLLDICLPVPDPDTIKPRCSSARRRRSSC